MEFITAILIRPRSRRYSHTECIGAEERATMWRDREVVIPKDDAVTIPCLLCERPLFENTPIGVAR